MSNLNQPFKNYYHKDFPQYQLIPANQRNLLASAILEFIGTDGIASLVNLSQKFWPESSIPSCRRFLKHLEKGGWVEHHFIQVCKQGQLVFTLTAKGARENFSQAARKNLMIGLPANSEIKQQMLAQKARMQLEEQLAVEGKRIIEWQNERQLRRETIRNIKSGISNLLDLNDNADARMTVMSKDGQTYRLEIEIDGEYYGQMLRTKLETYGKKDKLLLWVTTPNRASRIYKEIALAKITNISLLIVKDN